MSRLVIIDGHAIAHRAYHSIPNLSVNGQPVNVIYGFYSMLLTALDILKPDYLTVCLDSPGITTRQEEFLGYRAKRKIADHDLTTQLPLLKDSLDTAKICNFAVAGYEADDLIATIVKKALKKISKGKRKKMISEILIITGDKDLMQLVDSKVKLFMPIRGLSETKIFGIDEVKEKFGILPTEVVDLKALMGDMSDNYPGVAGIGPKVAVDLLNEYKNLDNIYSNLSSIKESVREKLIKDKDNAYLSQKLATLIYNIPLHFSLNACKWKKNSFENLISLFKTYNFKSLISRVEKRYNLKSDNNSKIKSKIINSNQTSLF